ncbi:AAA ATPase-like protein [Solirubrobacter pauli]|uniref:AAA ATPase-like protein n=1 Tax=Solirubrobacter pauli TaxID=166793 RepID=A0A660LFR2_9ACTN|nr:LuxR family transcriptional regulator [Solirubrobacter pauli]RKQ93025.1 AAA ATPase-like protein [Solirubrobacter pauli]
MTAAGAWPLVGRDAELERIAGARRRGDCPGVVVHAPAGAGKSRLAREAQSAAADEGLPVYWVQATRSASTIPLGAFAGVVPEDVRSDDTLELLRRSADALRRRARDRRVVLGVDDAQLLDPVSAALVLHLASSEAAFIVATVRAGEPVPDAIQSLWKDAGAPRLELGRLDDDAIAVLVEAGLGGPVERQAIEWVIGAGEGNPLFARELVLGALEAGTLVNTGGLWRLRRRPPVSDSLRELIGTRMAGLADDERLPVELLALTEPLRIEELTELAGLEPSVRAEMLGLIAIDTSADAARLAHPLYGETVRAELPALYAQSLRRRLADRLLARDPVTPETAMRVARLLLDAQQPVPAPLLVDAARAANEAGDPDFGARLAELALPGFEATLLLARAHFARKRFAEADALLATVDAEAEAAVSGDYVQQRVHTLYWGLRDADAARAFIARAGAWAHDGAWERRLAPLQDLLADRRGDFADTVRVTQAAIDGPETDPATRRGDEARQALAYLYTGEGTRAYELMRRLRPSVPFGYAETLAAGGFNLIAIETGEDLEDADAYAAGLLRDAVRVEDHAAAATAAFGLATTEFLRGRYRSSARWFDEAELHYDHQDTFAGMTVVHAFRVGIAAATGGDVTTPLERMREQFGPAGAWRHQVPYVERAEGWAAVARGEPDAAERFVHAADRSAKLPIFAVQLLYEAFRAGLDVRERMRAVAPRADSRLARACARHVAARSGAERLAVAAELAAMGALQYALEATVGAADAFQRAGDASGVRRAAARARELHQPDQGTPEPAIEGLPDGGADLTRREAQLVGLAREGLSNAEIADRLVVSVRTVESHLYRAMHKLGVGDRRDL